MVFKLCGSNVFEIAVSNEQFISVCSWLDGEPEEKLYLYYKCIVEKE